MSHLLFALRRLLSPLSFNLSFRVESWVDMALGSSRRRCALRVVCPVVCGIVAHVGSGVASKRQAAAVARLRLL